MDLPGTGSSLGNENHKVKKTTLNTFALKKDENIQVIGLYTNAVSLPNKINELKLVLNSHDIKPSVIAKFAITEIKHKHKWNTSLSELALKGYDLC